MILFRNKKESGHTLLSVASLRLKKDMEELATKRYLAGYANVNISISYIQGIYICVPVVFSVKNDTNSLYYNAIFESIIKVSPGYPFQPPEMWIMNKVYHPNVDIDTGYVCMQILTHNEWKPVMTLNSIIFAFELLINEPDFSFIPNNLVNLDMKNTFEAMADEFKWRVRKTMQGGCFYEKYFFTHNYGEVINKKRIRKQSSGPTKRLKFDQPCNMNIEIEWTTMVIN